MKTTLKLPTCFALALVAFTGLGGCAAEADGEEPTDGVAAAGDEGESSSTSEALAAPTCVTGAIYLHDQLRDYMRVTNRCASTVRVKVVVAHFPDSGCLTIGAHQSERFSWGWPGRFDRIVRC